MALDGGPMEAAALPPAPAAASRPDRKSAGAFSSLLRHRDLFRRLLLRDIQASVRGSIFGTAWLVITPLVLVAIYTFVFGVIMKSQWSTRTDSPLEVPLIYFSGLMVFTFFLEVVNRSPDLIRDNRTYVTKIIFPVEILNWVIAGTAGFRLLVSTALLAVFMLLAMQHLPASVVLLPLLFAPLLLLSVGFSWALSAAGTYIRDVGQGLTAISPVLMFVSPIFYSVDQVPAPLRFLFWLNPITFVLETTRGLLFFAAPFPWPGFLLYSAVALLVFHSGFALFSRARRGFADVI